MTGTRPFSSNITLSVAELIPSISSLGCTWFHESDRDAGLHHVLFDLGNAVLAEVEDARGEHRARSGIHGCDHMLRTSRPAGGDYGEGRLLGDGGDQIEVVTGLGSVCVHAVEHELTCPPPLSLDEPSDRVHPRVDPSAVQVDLPSRRGAAPFHVDAQHDTLAPEAFRSFGDEIRVPHGGAVYGDLVGPCAQHGAHVAGRPYAAADRVWYEDLLGSSAGERGGRFPLFVGGSDIVEDDLICPLPVVEGRELYRISGIPQVGESCPFYHPSGVHVEAWDDADFEAHQVLISRLRPGLGRRPAKRARMWRCTCGRATFNETNFTAVPSWKLITGYCRGLNVGHTGVAAFFGQALAQGVPRRQQDRALIPRAYYYGAVPPPPVTVDRVGGERSFYQSNYPVELCVGHRGGDIEFGDVHIL